MTETVVEANGVPLCVETFGASGDPALLLVQGAAASMDWWEPEFCARLAGGGRFVIRYDHRDTGRSVSYPPGRPGYAGPDLMEDLAGLIDVLAGGRAHLAGLSMGGALAQFLAFTHPDRVATLILLSTSSGPADDLPPMADSLLAAFADPPAEPDWSEPDAVVDYLVAANRPFAGAFDEPHTRELARRAVARATSPASAANHWLLDGGPALRPHLPEITAPTLIIHGTADPFFPPGHAHALAREIPTTTLLLLDGVGHEAPPPSTWDTVVPAILGHTAPA
jgi:pimeloyl-ACP methyl ester carboxylesterase